MKSSNKIIVIGDVILDKYLIGNVSRISPEAPIPIVKVTQTKMCLGGAANVCNNISKLGVNVSLIGLVGEDINGEIIKSLLKENNIDDYLIQTKYNTITKTRVIGEHQQIVRLDYEDEIILSSSLQNTILNSYISILRNCEIVIISDYGKGICNNFVIKSIINLAINNNKYVIVDPKGTNWFKYKYSTLITPNFKEFSEYVKRNIKNSDQNIEKYGPQLLMRLNLKYLLITRSELGMSLISEDEVLHYRSEAIEVFDVSGAGDTVLATIAASLVLGYNIKDAIIYANRAAGIVVSKFGTATVLKSDIFNK